MEIFVSGSLAYDRIMDFPGRFSDHILPDKIHMLNVCFLVNGVKEQFGGTAGNIAFSLVLLGEKPVILAAAGKDFGEYGDWLEGMGLSLNGVRIVPEELTAGAYITTDQADNQITGFNPGAMKHPSLATMDGAEAGKAVTIIAPGNVDDMVAYSKLCKERNIDYIFDPGQQIPVIPTPAMTDMITGSKMLISNDYELEMIMRSTGLGADDILNRTECIVTTLGDKGSVLRTRRAVEEIPAARASQVADPTGAGDSFRAGLIKGLVTGKELNICARMGAVSASYCVECKGTQCHRFTEEDFWERYAANFGTQE
jgi:adenosine kinase